MGRTPATIIGFQIGYSCLPEEIKELPEGEGQQANFYPFEHLLAAGDSIEISEPVVDVSDYMKASIKAIDDFKETAVFHGWVQYQHIFDNHAVKERFCYCYSPRLIRLNRAPKPKTGA